ncbi:MAG: heterodisulfide reductase-related iron-sulfur binding cluster [Nitriliruptoraceae bacterium]
MARPSQTVSDFFQSIASQMRERLGQLEPNWQERYETPTHAHDVILYLGCNVLRTPQVAHDVTRVFEKLGLNFTSVGGAQFCCGVPWARAGDTDKQERVAETTVERFASFGASTLVLWCPSCRVHFSESDLTQTIESRDIDVIDAAEFLAGLADDGRIAWRQASTAPQRVMLHAHAGRETSEPERTRASNDQRNVERILAAMPGIEIVGTAVVASELGYHCGFAEVNEPVYESQIRQLDEQARQAGAEAIVTISHACQRSITERSLVTVDVRNYAALLRDAIAA